MVSTGKDPKKIPEEEFEEIFDGVKSKFAQIKAKVYETVIGEHLTDEKFAGEFIQKAYCTYGDTEIEGESLIKQAERATQEHFGLVEQMAQGTFEADITEDYLLKYGEI